MLAPFSVGFIKGWRRSLAALIICEGIRSLGIELDDLTDQFKACTVELHEGNISFVSKKSSGTQ